MNVNLKDLKEVLRLSRLAHERGQLLMARWDCGTAACHVGNYARVHCRDRPCGDGWFHLSLAITGNNRLRKFLFTGHEGICQDAQLLTPEAAINRLAKVIAYFERKQKLWENEPERMRRQEGNWGFVAQAVEVVAV